MQALAWKNLGNTVGRERSPRQQATLSDPFTGKSIGTESRCVVTSGQGKWVVTAKGVGILYEMMKMF